MRRRRWRMIVLFGAVGVLTGWTFRYPLASRVGAYTMGATYLGDSAVHRQRSFADCGVAALHMIFDTHRRPFPRALDDSLLQVVRTRGEGLSFAELARLSTDGGLTAQGYMMNVAALRATRLPVIAHLTGHFIVVDRVTDTAVLVRDPTLGRLSLPLARFAQSWTGRVLVFSDVVPGENPGAHEPRSE
jgi:ABC-type bacteriocin/lantibiotic exporter with double-glycine peptidase domain